jgi:hypothetical protein
MALVYGSISMLLATSCALPHRKLAAGGTLDAIGNALVDDAMKRQEIGRGRRLLTPAAYCYLAEYRHPRPKYKYRFTK